MQEDPPLFPKSTAGQLHLPAAARAQSWVSYKETGRFHVFVGPEIHAFSPAHVLAAVSVATTVLQTAFPKLTKPAQGGDT